jgi:NAD(P)-dependent dehydrogenase (short-subunit alcohol dehydrogenase family)
MSSPVVLITGALTGIGRATALAFGHEGARVVVSGRHDDAGQKPAIELRNLGAEAGFVRTDVRPEDEVKNFVDKTIARFSRLDIAVNNAGTVCNPGPAADVTTECSTTLRNRRKTKQISSTHEFLTSASALPEKLQMPICSLALTRLPTSSVDPWRSTEA